MSDTYTWHRFFNNTSGFDHSAGKGIDRGRKRFYTCSDKARVIGHRGHLATSSTLLQRESAVYDTNRINPVPHPNPNSKPIPVNRHLALVVNFVSYTVCVNNIRSWHYKVYMCYLTTPTKHFVHSKDPFEWLVCGSYNKRLPALEHFGYPVTTLLYSGFLTHNKQTSETECYVPSPE